jgi:FkbM family methyltransferase
MGIDNLFPQELWMVDVMRKLLENRGGTFIDVGANIGQTLMSLRSISDMEYVGIEPNPACLTYLDQLIRANDIQNCTIIPCAINVEDKLDLLECYHENRTDSTASIIPEYRPDHTAIRSIPVVSLSADTISKSIGLNNAAVIKIDVEGAELEVLRSFRNIISAQRPAIVIEILPAYNKENVIRVDRQKEIQKLMFDLDYKLFGIKKSNGKFVGLEALDNIPIHGDVNASDYVFM